MLERVRELQTQIFKVIELSTQSFFQRDDCRQYLLGFNREDIGLITALVWLGRDPRVTEVEESVDTQLQAYYRLQLIGTVESEAEFIVHVLELPNHLLRALNLVGISNKTRQIAV